MSHELPGCTTKVENYLHAIISEYEDTDKAFSGNPPTKGLAELPSLQDFVVRHEESERFVGELQIPFHEAIKELNGLISSETSVAEQ
jgi:hypothetical protein